MPHLDFLLISSAICLMGILMALPGLLALVKPTTMSRLTARFIDRVASRRGTPGVYGSQWYADANFRILQVWGLMSLIYLPLMFCFWIAAALQIGRQAIGK